MTESHPLVITLLGPTAAGKTALALEIAEKLNLPVINVDSRQLYRGMDVGTAKPTAAQQARVPHHLLDLRDPDQPITLQEFQAEAMPCIEAVLQQCGKALLVGGSGLYLKALTQGLQPPAVAPQPQLRNQLTQLGQAICHPLLQAADPQAAARIAPADAVRTQRALEVLYATGQPMSSQSSATPPPGGFWNWGSIQPTCGNGFSCAPNSCMQMAWWRKHDSWRNAMERTCRCCRQSATAKRWR